MTGPNCNSLLLPPTAGLECGERIAVEVLVQQDDANHLEDDEDETSLPVTFHCVVPRSKYGESSLEFVFGCRRPSFGVLTGEEKGVEEDVFDSSAVDPNFFDQGYTLAGSTGFCVWAGARFMMDCMVAATATTNPELLAWQGRIQQGARVLELGAGVGLLGTVLAAAGAQVLMTDLPTLVDNAIRPNIRQNAKSLLKMTSMSAASLSPSEPPPSWLGEQGIRIGRGFASAIPLDWNLPLNKQLNTEQRHNIDVIVASDCIWLASLLDSLLSTVADLFDEGGASTFLMAFQKRESNIGSALFTTVEHLHKAVADRKWEMTLLAWRRVTLLDGTETEVQLVQIERP